MLTVQEYLRRPTSTADWWPPPHTNVLGSRDLARSTHGTWMGVTKQGKLAVLTNYREPSSSQAVALQSRGVIVNSWLLTPSESKQATRDFVQDVITGITATKVGGFSLVCGYLNEPLAIVSNRSASLEQVAWVATGRGQTRGLSNTSFEDRSWPKILDGERLMEEAIAAHVQAGEDEGEDALIDRLLQVLSRDTLPRFPDDATTETYIPHLRKSIFVPIIGQNTAKKASDEAVDPCLQDKAADQKHDQPDPAYTQGAYGTQKQTICLVSHNGRVRYFERTLYDNDVNAIPIGEGDRSFEYTLYD